MKRNTKYLSWQNKTLGIRLLNVSIVCDESTWVLQPFSSGWTGWTIVRPGCFSVPINANIARQLSKHLVHEESYQDFDKFKIKFE